MTARTVHERWLRELPTTWAVRTIGEIGSVISGSTPSRTAARYWGGDIPWVTPGEVTGLATKYLESTRERISQAGLDSCGTQLLPKNALLVTTRATIGAVALAGRATATNQGFKSVAFDGRAAPDFYYHLFKRLTPEFERRASGTTFLEVSSRQFSAVEVPSPPLPEQRQIASILDTIDDAIRKTEQLIAKLKQVKQGLLRDLLTRGIDDNGELRDPVRHPEQFKKSAVGFIPTEWTVKPCGELFDVQLGKMMSPAASAGPNQLRYLRNQNVHWDRLDLSDVATMHFEKEDMHKFRLQSGDLLACEGRFIGRCAIWRGEIENCYYQKALHRLRARDTRTTTDFMLFFMSLRFQYDRAFVEQMTHESTIPHLPLEKLVALPVLVPPRAEQDRIVAALRAMTSREQLESEYLAKAVRLKAGLMDDLLSGRVRVTNLLENAPQ